MAIVLCPAASAFALSPFSQGKEYHKAGAYALAQAAFEKDLQQNPKNALSHFYLGTIAFFQNDLDAAIGHFQKAVENDFYLPGGHYALGIAQKKKGDFAAAEASFRRAVKVEPDSAKNYFNWGVLLTRLNKDQEALYAFRQAVSLNRDHVYSHYNLADLCRRTGDYHDAIIHYEVVLRKKPAFAEARIGKALALEQVRRKDEALAELLKAVEMAPEEPRPYGFLARLYEDTGQAAKAARYRKEFRRLSAPAAGLKEAQQ